MEEFQSVLSKSAFIGIFVIIVSTMVFSALGVTGFKGLALVTISGMFFFLVSFVLLGLTALLGGGEHVTRP